MTNASQVLTNTFRPPIDEALGEEEKQNQIHSSTQPSSQPSINTQSSLNNNKNYVSSTRLPPGKQNDDPLDDKHPSEDNEPHSEDENKPTVSNSKQPMKYATIT